MRHHRVQYVPDIDGAGRPAHIIISHNNHFEIDAQKPPYADGRYDVYNVKVLMPPSPFGIQRYDDDTLNQSPTTSA